MVLKRNREDGFKQVRFQVRYATGQRNYKTMSRETQSAETFKTHR